MVAHALHLWHDTHGVHGAEHFFNLRDRVVKQHGWPCPTSITFGLTTTSVVVSVQPATSTNPALVVDMCPYPTLR